MTEQKPLWINGVRCKDFAEAAARLSLRLGRGAAYRMLSAFASEGRSSAVFKGITVTAFPPQAERGEPAGPGLERRLPLLRFRPGEAPLDRGANRAVR
jgi:hypothetical protein